MHRYDSGLKTTASLAFPPEENRLHPSILETLLLARLHRGIPLLTPFSSSLPACGRFRELVLQGSAAPRTLLCSRRRRQPRGHGVTPTPRRRSVPSRRSPGCSSASRPASASTAREPLGSATTSLPPGKPPSSWGAPQPFPLPPLPRARRPPPRTHSRLRARRPGGDPPAPGPASAPAGQGPPPAARSPLWPPRRGGSSRRLLSPLPAPLLFLQPGPWAPAPGRRCARPAATPLRARLSPPGVLSLLGASLASPLRPPRPRLGPASFPPQAARTSGAK